MGDSSLAIGRLLKEPDDEQRRERMLRRIDARRRSRGLPVTRLRVGLVAAAALLIVATMTLLWPLVSRPDQSSASPPTVLTLRGHAAPFEQLEVPADDSLSVPFTLSDGSTIELGAGSIIAARENEAEHFSLLLRRGTALFDVVPGQRRWVIDAGLASVEVLGTRFEVVRAERFVSVRVERGTVRVRSDHLDGAERLLHRGESLRVELSQSRPRPTSPAPSTSAEGEPVNDDERHDSSPDEPEAVGRSARGQSRWRTLAREGSYDEAFGQLGADGLVAQVSRARSIDELLLLADIARLSGHPREAVAPLQRAIAEHPGERRAAVAAFTLGRLQADVFDDHRAAARAFERCLASRPPVALQANALARLAEARQGSGDHEGARRAAEEYLRRYPEGPRADYLRERILSR